MFFERLLRPRASRLVFSVVLVLILGACGGGGGGGDEDLSQDACGAIGLPDRALSTRIVEGRIVEGTACGNLSASSVVRVLFLDSRGEITGFCSGTMLTSDDVLTAAHCVQPGTEAAAVVYGDPENSTTVFGRTVHVHPNYVPLGSADVPTALNDVAIVKLRSPIPVPTRPIGLSEAVESGDIISIFGYGTDENGFFDGNELKSGEMLVEDVTSNHVVAFYDGEGSNTCTGDSGGPAFATIGGQTSIVGITSTGTSETCSEGDTSFFIKVSNSEVADFIFDQVPDARSS